jgi:hypothetical protein
MVRAKNPSSSMAPMVSSTFLSGNSTMTEWAISDNPSSRVQARMPLTQYCMLPVDVTTAMAEPLLIKGFELACCGLL